MSEKNISRREFLGKAAGCLALMGASTLPTKNLFKSPYLSNTALSKKVIVLGIDGMDPELLKLFVARGEMPNFKKLMTSGHYSQLGTTMPPQSPVAWASFISGCNPGGHGIFDFIHRDPAKFSPYLSTSRTTSSSESIDIGKYSFPISSGKVENLRRGPAFWTTLENHNIPSTMFAIPADFPIIQEGTSKQISGMGTPDLLGTYGTFTYFTDAEVPGADKFTGGRVVPITLKNHSVKTQLKGPKNSFRTTGEDAAVDISIARDPWESVAKIKIQDHELVMKEGEWSEWLPLKFEFMPMFASVSGMVRIYLQEVHPKMRLYISPINIDPMDPTLPICNPSGFSRELSEVVGRFYTKGFPEDNKALSHGIFTNDEFFTHAKGVLQETLRVFDYQFSQFQEGLFFFYFSSVDQNSHMLWRLMDPRHPLYDPKASPETKNAVYYFYRAMDKVLGQVMSKVDQSTTLMVMSDHGFAPFTREFNVSTWLVENGFAALTDPSLMSRCNFYSCLDWSKTKAYVMGLNGIYLNLEGREIYGSVNPKDADNIINDLINKLKEVRDPKTGEKVLKNVYDSRKIYSGPYLALAPDIVLGYNRGYRISDDAVLGKFPAQILNDRKDLWSADHCMDSSTVPGVILSNRTIGDLSPNIWDLAPSIINAFGLKAPKEMDGKVIFA